VEGRAELCLPSFLDDRESVEEGNYGSGRNDTGSTIVEETIVDQYASRSNDNATINTTQEEGSYSNRRKCFQADKLVGKMANDCLQSIWEAAYRKSGYSRKTVELALAKWGKKTVIGRFSSWSKWLDFSKDNKLDYIEVKEESLLKFIVVLEESGFKGKYINKIIFDVWIIFKFFSNIEDKIPSMVNNVLKGLMKKSPINRNISISNRHDLSEVVLVPLITWLKLNYNLVLNLKEVRDFTIILVKIALLARGDDLAGIPMKPRERISKNGVEKYILYLEDPKGRDGLIPVELNKYDDIRICPVRMLDRYLEGLKNKGINTESGYLFRSNVDWNKNLSADRINNIVKDVMKKCNDIPKEAGSHTLRHATSQKLFKSNVDVNKILKAGRWKSFNVFNDFYNRQPETGVDVMGVMDNDQDG
jgi:hypothetical protein